MREVEDAGAIAVHAAQLVLHVALSIAAVDPKTGHSRGGGGGYCGQECSDMENTLHFGDPLFKVNGQGRVSAIRAKPDSVWQARPPACLAAASGAPSALAPSVIFRSSRTIFITGTT